MLHLILLFLRWSNFWGVGSTVRRPLPRLRIDNDLKMKNLDVETSSVNATFLHLSPSSAYENSVALSNVNDPPFGRLGNCIITMENMILESIASSCLVILPTIRLIPNFVPGCVVVNASGKQRNYTQSCLHASPKHFYKMKTTSTGELIADMRHSLRVHLNNILKVYFNINYTHAYGMPCPQENIFSIHIRSGDTSEGSFNETSGHFVPRVVHWKYAPNPTSFYTHVLRKALEMTDITRIIVFCEDLTSPSCETMQQFHMSIPRIEVRANKPLKDDLVLLSCSSHVALSAGTFFKAFTLETKNVHMFSRLGPGESDTSCSFEWHGYEQSFEAGVNVTKHYFSSREDADSYNKALAVWKNNEYQRHLVSRVRNMTSYTCESTFDRKKIE